MKAFSKILLLSCFMGLGLGAFSQISFGIKFMGLSYHPKKSLHPHLYKRKLDRWGHGVVNMGIVFQVEYFVNQNVSIKYSQALLQDCAGKFAGLSHLGMRVGFFMDPRQQHYGSAGLGPTFFYRKNWSDLDGYVNAGLLKPVRTVSGNQSLSSTEERSSTIIITQNTPPSQPRLCLQFRN